MANERDSVPLGPINPDAPGSTNEAVRRVRRKRRRRMLLKIVALMAVLTVAALFYAQTSLAMRQVWLPLVGRRLGTDVAAETATLSYGGRLNLSRLTVLGTDKEPALTASNVVFEIAPLSLLKGRPHVIRADATGVAIRVRVARDGRSNWDLPGLAQAEPQKPKQEHEAGAGAPNLRIDQVFLQNVTLDMQQADRVKLAASLPQLSLKNLEPGKEAEFDVALRASLERPAEKISQSGSLAAGGTIKQSADGRRIDWNASLKSSLAGTAPGLEGEQKVDVQATSKGNWNLGGLIEQTFALRAASPAGPAGSIDGAMTWDAQHDARRLKLTVSGIGRESLNPILATVAPLQLQHGKIDATATVDGTGDRVAFDAVVAADGLTFELAGRQQPTSVMNLRLVQSGEADLKTGRLTWRRAELTLGDEAHRLVQAVLDKPLAIGLGGGAAAQAADEDQAAFRATIDALKAANLQPWLMLAGAAPASMPTAGTLTGTCNVAIGRDGARIKAEGHLDADGLLQAALGPNPFNLRNRFDVTLSDFDELNIQKLTVELAAARGTIAQATLGGRMRLKQRAAELNVDLTAPATLAAAAQLGLLAGPAAGVRDGRLQIQQELKLDLAKGKAGSNGKLTLAGMSLANPDGQTAPLNLTGENRLTFDIKRGRIDIDSARLSLDYGAAKPGLVELTGHWEKSPAAALGVGALHLTAGGLNLTPWLLASGAIDNRNAPPIPFEASEQFAADAGGRVHVQGDMRIGIDPGDTAQAQYQAMTLNIDHDLVQAGAQLQKAAIEISSLAGGAAIDRVRIDATGTLGDAPAIQLAARAEKLDLNPYLAWADRLTAAGPKAVAPATRVPAVAQKPARAARAVIDARLTADELQYRDSKLTQAQATYRYDNGAMTASLSQGTFNNGALKIGANADLTRTEPRYAWDVTLTKADASRVLAIADASLAKRVSGELTLRSRGTGQGSGEALKRALQADTTFTVANGSMNGIFLLDELAKQTLVKSFSNLKFFDFSGRIDIADKVGKLKDVKLTGPEHRIDIEGQFDMDGNYNVTLLPAVATGIAGDIKNNKWLPSLVQAAPGFLQFPFKIQIKGDPRGYRVLPLARLPVNLGNVGGAVEGVVGGAAEAVGGVVKEIPGSGIVTRPITELKKLNPFSRDRPTTK